MTLPIHKILNSPNHSAYNLVQKLESKEFDRINHRIFLDKPQDIGASTSALRWFTSLLSKRSQVWVDSTLSDAFPLASGIPQGSIFGPLLLLLFTIYVNDLSTVPKNCPSDCYTDDTKLYMSFGVHDCKNVNAVAAMNEDLLRLRYWCFGNRLLINKEKTKLIIYGSRQMTERLPQFHYME